MSDLIAKPENGSYGTIDGVEITEEVIARMVRNAEEGFPGTKFKAPGRPARTSEKTVAVTVRLSETELAELMKKAKQEQLSRSEALRAAVQSWAKVA